MTPIYPQEWMLIHPYHLTQPSDAYFIKLANQLLQICQLTELPQMTRKKLCLYAAAYLEDQISGLGLWQSFTAEHNRLYGSPLPFYPPAPDYQPDEINVEDLCFLIWNTWQKIPTVHPFVNPKDSRIRKQAEAFYTILAQAYEEAPENDFLKNYFTNPGKLKEADQKLTWLFGHTYLTEPSMLPYIERITSSDRFIVPTGPLALFLHEWISLLGGNEEWKNIKELFVSEPPIPEKIKENNRKMYQRFTDSTGGKNIVYLKGYNALRQFLVEVLKWQDDDNHTLPQMKPHRDFILMTHPEKGILLAKDICEYIADPENPLYNRGEAATNAFRLLTEESLCPPDLLTYCIKKGFLADASLPGGEERELIQQNADFIARHSLLYYYRGD